MKSCPFKRHDKLRDSDLHESRGWSLLSLDSGQKDPSGGFRAVASELADSAGKVSHSLDTIS
jgi:hypothetical protein